MSHSQYICYFGLLEPLVQTQVLPYLRELLKDGHKISLLTFEPNHRSRWSSEKTREMRQQLADEGIRWDYLPYHKRFSVIATAYDVLNGALFVRRRIVGEPIDILHGRVHTPVLMAALARKFSKNKPKLLFDIRGFFPEEYTDAGRWPKNGWLFKTAKRVEKWLLKESDGFVVLTEKARDILFPESAETGKDKVGRPVEVIPCCVDLERFHLSTKSELKKKVESMVLTGRKVICYVGSFGGWYMTDAMLELFSAARERDPKAFALVLTQSPHGPIVDDLRAKGFAEGDFFVGSVLPDKIPEYLECADVAVSFILPCYSKLSSSPTKIAEYLACGVPIITNRGVGDVAEVVEKYGVGIVVDNFDRNAYVKALIGIDELGDLRSVCAAAARKEFDLRATAGPRYRRIYSALASQPRATEGMRQ